MGSGRRADLVNLASLGAIQGANAVTPLLVFPYVLAIVGAEAYSRLAVTEALAAAVFCVSQFSFDIEGVGRIAGKNLESDRDRISREFSLVLAARLLAFAVAAGLALLACALIPGASVGLLAWWLLVPFSYVLSSLWLFQGLERNAPAALAMVGSRLAFAGIVFLWVRDASDLHLVPAAMGITFMAGALITLAVLQRGLGIRLVPIRLGEATRALRGGRHIFAGNLSVFLYKDLNVMLLSLAGASHSAVAAYSIAEKVAKALQATTRPLTQLCFPKILAKLGQWNAPNERAARAIVWLARPLLLVVGALAIAVPLLAGYAAPGHPGKAEIFGCVAVMVPSILFGVMNFLFGSAGLNFLNRREAMLRAVLLTGLSNLVVCFVLSRWLGSIGAAASFTLAEILLFALCLRPYFGSDPGKRKPPTDDRRT